MSKAPETLTVKESERLLSALRSEERVGWSAWKNQRNYTMCLLMLDAGLRVGEVVKLKVNQIIFCGNPVQAINAGQGIAEKKCERIIPVSDRLSKALDQMNRTVWSSREEIQAGYAFFEGDIFRHITVRQVERIIYNASIRCLNRPLHPHVLRHTFATRLMRVTKMPVVQQLLGHKNLSSTQVYVHPNGDDCKKAIDELSGR